MKASGPRPDRKAKLSARSSTRETVVKCTLDGSLRLAKNEPARDAFVSGITARVAACSQRTANAGVALNLFLQRAFDRVADVSSVSLPQFWSQTFLRQLMLGTADAQKPSPEIASLHALYPELLYDHDCAERYRSDRNVYSAAAKRLSTNLKTHLIANTERMVRRLVYSALSDPEQAVAGLHAICGWQRRVNRTELPPLSAQAQHVVGQARRALGLGEGEALNDRFFEAEDCPARCVRFLVLANRCLQAASGDVDQDGCGPDAAARPVRLCTLAPISKLKLHFVTLDTYSLYGLAKDAGLIKRDCNEAAFVKNGQDHWHSIFKIDRIKGQGCSFTGTVDTDGTAVCFHFQRPVSGVRVADSRQQWFDPQRYRVLGVDPGRSNILYIVEQLPGGAYKKYVLTRSQYYAEAGVKAANAWAEKWNQGVREQVEALSLASPKGASLPRFLAFMETWLTTRAALFEEYSKPRWAEQRMRLYGGKKRVFATFLNRVAGPGTDVRPTVLAYGAAKFAATGSGEVAAPTSRAFKECSARFRCVLTDEFRTTQAWHEDGRHLQKVAVPSDPKEVGLEGPAEQTRRFRVVRGLLWCGSTSNEEQGKFVNRDLNAAINIRNCVIASQRPSWLSRELNPAALPRQQVAKLIAW